MTPSSNGAGPETILLVEDATYVRKLIEKILRADGFEVLAAADGAEALMIATDYPRNIHLLLSDVIMPGTSGPELAKQLKELRPEMKVLLMSGYAQGMIVLNYGWYFIQKPFIPVALVARIRDMLKIEVRDQGTDHYDTRV